MKKGTFEDLLPQETVERMLLSRVSVGEVFRMHLGKEENIKGKNPGDDGRNKYFVVLGHDLDGNAIGVVIIDTEINPNLPPRRQQMHYQLSAKKYAFLTYIIHSGFISGYQNRYGDNLKPPTNVYHRMTA